MKKENYNVAVVGATGAVGEQMREVLEEREFPVGELRLLASERSAGQFLPFKGKQIRVDVLTEDSFNGIDIGLFSAGGSVSAKFAPVAVNAGAVVVDNTACFRMEPDIPLVVPEVNAKEIAHYKNRGIVANPNCSTIQMVVALKPIHDAARIKRVVVSTYQSVSGAGRKAMEELSQQVTALYNGQELEMEKFPHQIAFNCIPHIDAFVDGGYTKEELKMINETRKIFGEPSLRVTATTVRVPVFCGHSESVNIETEKKLTAADVKAILREAPGVVVADEPENNVYPMATRGHWQGCNLRGANPRGRFRHQRPQSLGRRGQFAQRRSSQRRPDCGDSDSRLSLALPPPLSSRNQRHHETGFFMNIKLSVEYDGTNYLGWQMQPNGPTIQSVLEQAVSTFFGAPTRVTGSGRTDAGVHALGQVVNFFCDREPDLHRLRRGLNALTPDDISIKDVEIVPDSFDARRDGRSRTYEYRILNRPSPSPFYLNYAWHLHDPLDARRMRKAVRYLEGEHDFSCFRASGCDAPHPVRTVYRSSLDQAGDLLVFTIEATAFLRHMARNIVGTLVEVGHGQRPPRSFAELLEARDRTKAGPTAPPHGLFLMEVKY